MFLVSPASNLFLSLWAELSVVFLLWKLLNISCWKWECMYTRLRVNFAFSSYCSQGFLHRWHQTSFCGYVVRSHLHHSGTDFTFGCPFISNFIPLIYGTKMSPNVIQLSLSFLSGNRIDTVCFKVNCNGTSCFLQKEPSFWCFNHIRSSVDNLTCDKLTDLHVQKLSGSVCEKIFVVICVFRNTFRA